MRILCVPEHFPFKKWDTDLNVILYGKNPPRNYGSIGRKIAAVIKAKRLRPSIQAWDFLSIALSIYAADRAGHRNLSYDGWTRNFTLFVAVNDPAFWNSVKDELNDVLRFLTTDVWKISFLESKFNPSNTDDTIHLQQNSVALFSGGLDSLVGAIDLSSEDIIPILVSQISRGDKSNQESFPKEIDTRLLSILFNHTVKLENPEKPASQRSRSIVFISYGILIATTCSQPESQSCKKIFLSENGFISINPPLTETRVGSLSTRTTHPAFLSALTSILKKAGFNIEIINEYSLKTKGEMLAECKNQKVLKKLAHETTSCGRFTTFGYEHCGRCLPCLVRRAAFLKWGCIDKTKYRFEHLGENDEKHAGFDDVRSAMMACLQEEELGTKLWIGHSLRSIEPRKIQDYIDLVGRGIQEIRNLLCHYGVK